MARLDEVGAPPNASEKAGTLASGLMAVAAKTWAGTGRALWTFSTYCIVLAVPLLMSLEKEQALAADEDKVSALMGTSVPEGMPE